MRSEASISRPYRIRLTSFLGRVKLVWENKVFMKKALQFLLPILFAFYAFVPSSALQYFPQLPKSEHSLDVSMSDYGDKEAADLRNKIDLRQLNLSLTQISNEAIKNLAGMASLEGLYLVGTNIDGTVLPEISKLRSLKVLYLANTKVSGERLRELAYLPLLQILDLSSTPIQAKDLQFLEGCPIRDLDISNTDMTNEMFEYLRKLPHLERLSMRNTGVKPSFALWKNKVPDVQINNMSLGLFAQFSKNGRKPHVDKEQEAPSNCEKRIAVLTKRASENLWSDLLESATLLTIQGRYNDAIALFEELIPSIQESSRKSRCGNMSDMFAHAEFCARTNCASCYLANGDFEKAREMASAAIELERESAIPRRIRGDSFLKLGQFHEALSDLNRAIFLDPRMGSAYALRAETEQKLGKDSEARSDMRSARELGFNKQSNKNKQFSIRASSKYAATKFHLQA